MSCPKPYSETAPEGTRGGNGGVLDGGVLNDKDAVGASGSESLRFIEESSEIEL
jgi:hypothetical protein